MDRGIRDVLKAFWTGELSVFVWNMNYGFHELMISRAKQLQRTWLLQAFGRQLFTQGAPAGPSILLRKLCREITSAEVAAEFAEAEAKKKEKNESRKNFTSVDWALERRHRRLEDLPGRAGRAQTLRLQWFQSVQATGRGRTTLRLTGGRAALENYTFH